MILDALAIGILAGPVVFTIYLIATDELVRRAALVVGVLVGGILAVVWAFDRFSEMVSR